MFDSVHSLHSMEPKGQWKLPLRSGTGLHFATLGVDSAIGPYGQGSGKLGGGVVAAQLLQC